MPYSFAGRFRELLAPLSPRRRRWERFLASLPVDPDASNEPIAPPGEADFIICGAPRSGTTLVAAQLFQPPSVITVMEPWDGFRLMPRPLFESLREEIETTGALRRGKLDLESLRHTGQVKWTAEGSRSARVDTTAGWQLGVKWPGFWRYLPHLPDTRFIVCLRDPIAVLNSYRQKGGRLGRGLEYEIAFHRHFNEKLQEATADDALRRVLLYERVHEAILPHLDRPNVFAVHYERWFREPEVLMTEIGAFLGVSLGNGPASIRRSPREATLPADEIDLLRRHASSIQALGYEV